MGEYVQETRIKGGNLLRHNSDERLAPPQFCMSMPGRGGDSREKAYGEILKSGYRESQLSVVVPQLSELESA